MTNANDTQTRFRLWIFLATYFVAGLLVCCRPSTFGPGGSDYAVSLHGKYFLSRPSHRARAVCEQMPTGSDLGLSGSVVIPPDVRKLAVGDGYIIGEQTDQDNNVQYWVVCTVTESIEGPLSRTEIIFRMQELFGREVPLVPTPEGGSGTDEFLLRLQKQMHALESKPAPK